MKKFFYLFSAIFLVNQCFAFTLNDGYDLALKNDMDTQIRKNDLKIIKYDIDIASSLNYPKIDIQGKIETSKKSDDQLTPNNNINHTKTDEYEIKLKQAIYDGNDATYEKEMQEARYKSAKYYFFESKNSLALKFTQSYIDMLKQKDILNLYMESYIASKNIYNKITRKLLKGLGTKLEYEKAKGDFEENKVNLDIQRINYKNAYENLKFFTQKEFDTNELMKPLFYYELPNDLNKATTDALLLHPSVLVTKNNVLVSKYEQKRDKKSFHPKVDLVSSYKIDNVAHETNNEYNEYKIGVEFSYNLYNGGKDVANNQKALRKIQEKKHLIQKTKQEIRNRLNLAWTSYKLNQKKLKSIKDYVYTKKMILDAMMQEFDLGFQDLSSVLEEHIKYINVKRDLISTSYDLLLSKYKILEAMGILSSTLDNEANNDPTEEQDALVKKILQDGKYQFNVDNEIKNSEQKVNLDKIDMPDTKKDIHEAIPKDLIYPEVKATPKKPIKIEKKIKKSTIKEPSNFKDKFLNASKEKYTINLALAYSEKSALQFLKKHNIAHNAFAIKFGKPKQMYKIMLGVFDSKLEALEAINTLSSKLKRNKPRIEKIEKKQKLYKKYNTTNEK